MRFNLLSQAILAFAASRALAEDTPSITSTQAITLLNNLVTGLQSAGDVRVKLQAATPKLDAQNVIPFHHVCSTPKINKQQREASPQLTHASAQSLNTVWTQVLNYFPNKTGDFNIGSFTSKQQAQLCALLPKIDQVGHHATDTLVDIPKFHSNGPAYDAELALGGTISTLAWNFNMLYWSLHDSNDAVKCDHAVAVSLEDINHVLNTFGDNLIY